MPLRFAEQRIVLPLCAVWREQIESSRFAMSRNVMPSSAARLYGTWSSRLVPSNLIQCCRCVLSYRERAGSSEVEPQSEVERDQVTTCRSVSSC